CNEIAGQGYFMLRLFIPKALFRSTPHSEYSGWDLNESQLLIVWQIPDVLPMETEIPYGAQRIAGLSPLHRWKSIVFQRAHQPCADALNLVTAVVGDTLDTAVLHQHLRGQQRPPMPGILGQLLAWWLCKTQRLSQRPGRRGQATGGFGSSQQGHFAPAVGFSTQQPGEFVFEANIRQVARRQVFLECPMREGVNADATWFQDASTVTEVLNQQGRAYLWILAQVH